MMTRRNPEFTFTVRFDSEVFCSLLESHLASEKNAMFGTPNHEKTSLFSDWSDDFHIVDHKRGKKIGSISMKSVDCQRINQASDEILPPESAAVVNNDAFDCSRLPNSIETEAPGREQLLSPGGDEGNQFAVFMDYGSCSAGNIDHVQLIPDTQVDDKCVLPVQVVPPSNHIVVDSKLTGALVPQQNIPRTVTNEDNVVLTAEVSNLNQYQIPSNSCLTTESSNTSAFHDNEAQNHLDNMDSNSNFGGKTRFRPYLAPGYKRQCSNDLASQNTQMDHKLAYRCKDCNHVSKSSRMLRKHIYHSHIQSTPFHCAMCEYAATQNCDLSYHYLSIHKLDIDTVASLIRSSTRERERFSSPEDTKPDVNSAIGKKPVQSSSRVASRVGSTITPILPLTENPVFDVVNTLGSQNSKGSLSSTSPA